MTDRTRGRARPPGRPSGDSLGGDQVEGLQAVRELLVAARRRVREILVSDTVAGREPVVEIVRLGTAAGADVRLVSPQRLAAEARTETPQGVVARARPLESVTLDALCGPSGGRRGPDRRAGIAPEPAGPPAGSTRPDPVSPFLVVLDGVTDPGNLGAIYRTAEVSGATGVVLPRHRAAHVTPTVAKAAAGAIEYLPTAVVAGVPAAMLALRDRGVWTVGLDAEAEQSVFALDLGRQAVAVVLGAEGAGLSRLARERCDLLVSIPRAGRIASLNVAAAAAVACFEVARRRQD